MDAIPPKKMLILNILEILRKYSDENHRLSQKEIQDILAREYATVVDRKAVKRNLMDLLDNGYDLGYSEKMRTNRAGEEEIIYSDWYIEHEFTDAELRLLVDGLLFSKHIPVSQCKDLVKKLEGLSNKFFSAKVRHIRTMPDSRPENPDLFYTIDVLDEAISTKKRVSFHYNEYGVDKRQHRKRNNDGSITEYKVNPYQMAAINGRYYLICSPKYIDAVSHYRIDRISGIRLLDEPITPMREIPELAHGLNLPKHMAEHLYMFTGESSRVKFRARKEILNDIMDWFDQGTNGMILTADGEDHVICDVYVNELAMQYWAMQYGESVEVLAPKELRERVYQAAKTLGSYHE